MVVNSMLRDQTLQKFNGSIRETIFEQLKSNLEAIDEMKNG